MPPKKDKTLLLNLVFLNKRITTKAKNADVNMSKTTCRLSYSMITQIYLAPINTINITIVNAYFKTVFFLKKASILSCFNEYTTPNGKAIMLLYQTLEKSSQK